MDGTGLTRVRSSREERGRENRAAWQEIAGNPGSSGSDHGQTRRSSADAKSAGARPRRPHRPLVPRHSAKREPDNLDYSPIPPLRDRIRRTPGPRAALPHLGQEVSELRRLMGRLSPSPASRSSCRRHAAFEDLDRHPDPHLSRAAVARVLAEQTSFPSRRTWPCVRAVSTPLAPVSLSVVVVAHRAQGPATSNSPRRSGHASIRPRRTGRPPRPDLGRKRFMAGGFARRSFSASSDSRDTTRKGRRRPKEIRGEIPAGSRLAAAPMRRAST